MKFSQYSIDKTEFDELKGECPINTFKVFDPSQIPLSLPSELLDKSLKVVVMGSGDSANAVYMVNLLRVDQPKNAIGQEPLIIAYHSGDSRNYQGRWVYFDKQSNELRANDFTNWATLEF